MGLRALKWGVVLGLAACDVPGLDLAGQVMEGQADAPACAAEDACCVGSTWTRPGGFWSPLQGHLPDWQPEPLPPLPPPDEDGTVCGFGDRDDCGRLLGQRIWGGCFECDGCESLVQTRYTFDDAGRLTLESYTEASHRDLFDPNVERTSTHTYDEAGRRTGTHGHFYLERSGEGGGATFVYINDDQGRLIEETVDWEPVIWEPDGVVDRRSTFTYEPDGTVTERVDADADGTVDEVLTHGP